MELAEAYRILEIAPGATKEQTREARNVLAKVWHPDRHQGDPKVHDRAADKLRQINDAYAVIEGAGFPAAEAPRPREAPPAYVDSLRPQVQPRRTAPHATAERNATTQRSRARSGIELVPRRRVRMWVPILLVIAAASAGITIAIQKRRNAPVAQSSPTPTPTPTPVPEDPSAAFTLGSTKEDVRRVMGPPTSVDTTFGERWNYGMADVEFRDGKVFAWRSSAFDKLKVRLAPRDAKVAEAARARGSYGEHADRDEVLGVEGPPDGLDYTFGETWEYGMSNVKFVDGHIDTVWNTHARPLHVTSNDAGSAL